MKCAFCELPEIRKRIIVKNENVFVFPTNIPIVPGHLLICPVRCIAKFNDLNSEERKAISNTILKLKPVLKKIFKAEGFNYAWNEREVAGQNVPHFHLHMIPRKKGDTGITKYEPRKFLYRPGSREKTPEKELQSIANKIKEFLK